MEKLPRSRFAGNGIQNDKRSGTQMCPRKRPRFFPQMTKYSILFLAVNNQRGPRTLPVSAKSDMARAGLPNRPN